MLQRLLRFNSLAFTKEGVIYCGVLEQKCSIVSRNFEMFLAKEWKLKQDNFYHSPTKPPIFMTTANVYYFFGFLIDTTYFLRKVR